MKNHKKALFIFRRDLRIQDNTGLIEAAQQSEQVIPCFIFDPQQTSDKNKFRSLNALQFMLESLKDLEEQIKKKGGKLYLFYGVAENVVKELIKQEKIDAVFCNRDYTPFSLNRDDKIKRACQAQNSAFEQSPDALLHEPEEIKTQNGEPYSVYTAFHKACVKYHTVNKPRILDSITFYTKPIDLTQDKTIYKKILPKTNPNIHAHGGRRNGLSLLKKIKNFNTYNETRDYPTL